MDKKKELIKNTAIIAFGRICTQLVSFFLLPLYTGVLSQVEYGTVDLVITYSTLLLPIVTLALEQSVFRFLIDVRDNETKKKEYISNCLTMCVAVLLFTEMILVIVSTIVKSAIFVYFGVVLITSALSTIFLQICRGLGDNVGYSVASFIAAILQILSNIVCLVILKLGAEGMMIATCVGNLACVVYIGVKCKLYRYISLKSKKIDSLKMMLKYSIPLIPNLLSWWVLQASDKVIVQFFIGVSGNGIIAVANKFSGAYMQFNAIFNVSWTESVALHIKEDDAKEFISKTINSVMNLFSSMCFCIIACMPFVFRFLVNEQFAEAYGIIPIFMLASLFNVMVSVYGVIYVAYKDTVEIMKTAMFAAAINIISHLVLIKWVGIYAAAISTMIGFGFMAIYRYFHSRKYITIKLYRKNILISLLMMVMSCAGYYMGNLFLQISSLIIVILISIYLNRVLLKGLISKQKAK